MDESKPNIEVPPEAATVNHTFYRKGDTTVASAQSTQPALAPSDSTSSTRPREGGNIVPLSQGPPIPAAAGDQAPSSSASGTITVHIPSLIDVDRRPVDILADEIEKHAIPDEEKFELLTRIRCASALGKGPMRQKERENVVVIRLFAIAIFGAWTSMLQPCPSVAHAAETPCLAHTMNESEAQNSLFIYEPELIAHIAELIHPDRSISVHIQTAVIAALDGLSRYRGKTGEVLASVNAGVTHGTLMSLMRRTVAQLTDPNCALVLNHGVVLEQFTEFACSEYNN